jgi:hypothetical protein
MWDVDYTIGDQSPERSDRKRMHAKSLMMEYSKPVTLGASVHYP